MSETLLHLLIGALGGISATGPMTILMERWHRRLPPADQHPLPPREITDELEDKIGIAPASETTQSALVLLNHFAYGAAAGAVYAGARGRGISSGLLYGAALWAFSYLQLLPTASLLRPATEHSPRRNALMFAAHLLWGLTLGLFVREITRDRRDSTGALASPPNRIEHDRPKTSLTSAHAPSSQ